MGRRKISIKQIADPKLRHITFNKRRNGLIKKAAELSLLCNVNMLLIFEDGNGGLVQFSRNKITTIPSFFKSCTYSSVSEFTSNDYPNFFKVNHYKKHQGEEETDEIPELDAEELTQEPEEVAPEFDESVPIASPVQIINKRESYVNAAHCPDGEDYMSDHMVYYSGSEDSNHDGSDGVRTFSEPQVSEPYYNQPKPSQYMVAKPRPARSEESQQKPVIYEPEMSRPYPEEQEGSPVQRETYQNYKEIPIRVPIHEEKPIDYPSPQYVNYERPPVERMERPMKRPSYPENGQSYRYYPEPPSNYPNRSSYPHEYPYHPYNHPYPPAHYGYPMKQRPRAYREREREMMPCDETVNNMFKYPARGFGMDATAPYMSKPSNKQSEMDDKLTGPANMVKYLNNSGTNTSHAGQKIYNFYSSENGNPEEEMPMNYGKTRNEYEAVPYEAEYQEYNPYYRGDYRYESNLPNNLPTNLPAAYFSSKKFNFEGYPTSFEDDRFNEFSDPKKKLKQ